MTLSKDFVTFWYCVPFDIERKTKEIASWDVSTAMDMAKTAWEGYNPYAFTFSTRSREDNELDSTETEKSGMYFLGGEMYRDGVIEVAYAKPNWGKIGRPFSKRDTILDVSSVSAEMVGLT